MTVQQNSEALSMIERVARALRRQFYIDNFDRESEVGWEDEINNARAAIEAMRDPTEVMLIATEDVVSGHDDFAVGDGTMYLSYPGYYDDALEAWKAMIDAALNEQVEDD